jgi:hypothetical protein
MLQMMMVAREQKMVRWREENSADDMQASDEVNDSTVTKQVPPANEEQEDKKKLPTLEDESRTKIMRVRAP